MEIKYTIQGLLIYATIAAYLCAFVTSLLRRAKIAHILYLLGFAIAVFSFGYRWYHVRHVPLQNLFEVFLCLGMIYPVSLFCRRFLRVGGYSADMLIGAIVLFPAAFSLTPSRSDCRQPCKAGFFCLMSPSTSCHISLWQRRLSRPFCNWLAKAPTKISCRLSRQLIV